MTTTAEPATDQDQRGAISEPWRLVAVAASLGALTTALVYATVVSGEPTGIGVAFALVTMAAAIHSLRFRDLGEPSATSRTLSVAAAVFAVFMALRSSPTLTTLNAIAAFGLLLGAISTYGGDRAPVRFVTSMVVAGSSALAGAAVATFSFVGHDLAENTRLDRGKLSRWALGALLALPVVVVLVVLLGAADSLFAAAVDDLLTVPAWSPAAAWLTLMTVWITVGGVRWVAGGPGTPRHSPRRPSLPAESAAIVIGSSAAVLGGFASTQIGRALAAYGSDSVSHSAQARSGFFELSAVTAVVLVVILVTGWAVGDARPGRGLRRLYRALALLSLPVVVSAFVRLVLYIDAFGLTQLRALTTIGVVWMAGTLVWATHTVVRGRRDRFAQPAITALLVVLLAINVANFDARIAQVNLAALGDQPLDSQYLATGLSPDAIPTVVAHIGRQSDPCTVVDLAARLHVAELHDLRSWNLGTARAAAALDSITVDLAGCTLGTGG